MAKKEEILIRASTGNVFADLGRSNAEELQAKAELALQINTLIQERSLTQAKAAKLLGIDQPKVSALARGRLSGFSLERLSRFLNALGSEVEIVVRPAVIPRIYVTLAAAEPIRFGLRERFAAARSTIETGGRVFAMKAAKAAKAVARKKGTKRRASKTRKEQGRRSQPRA